jgi:peptidoglycan/xylan/chitin deacetylase (PgdA/CDA1 family)
MPLTVFVCPELAGRNAPFWPERVAATLRALRPAARQTEIETIIEHLKRFTPEKREQWVESFLAQTDVQRVHVDVSDGDSTLLREEIGEMDRAGVRFGSHSNTHQILTSLPASTARREIRESQAALERELGRPCDLFAYPNGEYSLEIRQILVEQGYRLAFTTKRGAWTPECDRLAIPRSNVCERNLAGLMGKFSPSMFEYTNFWKVWRAMKADERSEVRADHRPASATVCGGAGAP